MSVVCLLPILWGIYRGLEGLAQAASHTLAVAACALVAWTILRWDDTRVALLAGMALVGLQVVSPDAFFSSLGDSVIWLLLGAFMLSAVLRGSGVAHKVVLIALRGTPSFQGLCWRLCWIVAATAWVIPSTSARAALLLPVYLVLAQSATPAQSRALALLFPSIILLSAGGALLGAGAHLIAIEFIHDHTGTEWNWLEWTALTLPFVLGNCCLATWMVMRLFLNPAERQARWSHAEDEVLAWNPQQKRIGGIAFIAVLGWAGGSLIGIDAATVALLAGVLVSTPALTGFKLAAVLKQVEWNLLLFMAATLVLGQALLDTGAAKALAQLLMARLQLEALAPELLIALAALIAVCAHLLVPSRTARAVVLLPTVGLPLATAGLDLALVAMVLVQGTGFCQTLTASAKPVAVFSQAETGAFTAQDLLRLAFALAPCIVLWLAVQGIWYWS